MMRFLYRISLTAAFVFLFGGVSDAQPPKRTPTPTPTTIDQGSKATAAYAEIALKRADVEAELESLLVEYTDEFPKVRELKYSLTRIDVEAARVTSLKAAERDRATEALGKLIIRKVDAEIELWKLSQDYADAHPDVKRAKKKVEIFEKAIKEILG